LRLGLVDEVALDVFPALIGGTHTSSLFSAPDLQPDELPTPLELLSAEKKPENNHLWLYYRVKRS
jgi:hypothetical protein